MGVTRRSFEDGIRGLSNTSASNNKTPDVVANDQVQRLSEFVSRPLGSGKRSSSLTVKLGDRSLSSGSSLAQQLRTSLARTSGAYRADSAISGTRVGTDNLTGAPLANESGSATLHSGIATGSNVTPIRIPAPKADLPGVPAILTRGSPLLGNRQVLMSFLKTKAFGGGASQGSSINTNSVPLPDDCDPGFTNVDFESDDEPEDPPLPPEDQGGSPLEPGEPPPPPVNFNCTPSGCVRSATGTFDTLPECEAVCQQRYSCENSNCVPDPNGTHANLSLCLNACQSRYTCIDGTCVAFPTGGFATLIDCVESCETPLEEKSYSVTWSGSSNAGALCDGWTRTPAFQDYGVVTSWRPPTVRNDGSTFPLPLNCCTESCAKPILYGRDSNDNEITLLIFNGLYQGCCANEGSFTITELP